MLRLAMATKGVSFRGGGWGCLMGYGPGTYLTFFGGSVGNPLTGFGLRQY